MTTPVEEALDRGLTQAEGAERICLVSAVAAAVSSLVVWEVEKQGKRIARLFDVEVPRDYGADAERLRNVVEQTVKRLAT